MELPEIRPEERTPLVEVLLGIIRHLWDVVAAQEETIRQLRDEIDRLKGQTTRPNIQPSRLEASPPEPKDGEEGEQELKKRPGSAKRPKTAELTIHRHVPLRLDHPPAGAKSRGFESYVVQDLHIENVNTEYQRERYELPDGSSVLALAGLSIGLLVNPFSRRDSTSPTP